MLDFLVMLGLCFLGVLVGIATGILPGLHVNTVALILLFLSSAIADSDFVLLLFSGFIISASISHSFHNIIPATFLGAPDEDTALSILPTHSLLLEGRGYEAVALSALGSFGAIVACLLFLYCIKTIDLLYSTLQEIMVWLLIAISIFMLATERNILFATLVFFLSGIFGVVALDFELPSLVGINTSVLFPALTGLFGIPTLLNSLMTKPDIPRQKVEKTKVKTHSSLLSILTGSVAGIFVSIVPGITSAIGTLLATNIRGESGKEQTIITLSSVNTASAFSVIVVLFVILKPRSGVAIAVNQLISIEKWCTTMPTNLVYLLLFLVLSLSLIHI